MIQVDQTNYYQFVPAFTEQELEWIGNLQQLYPFVQATTVGNSDEGIRKSSIKWIHSDERSGWVYDRINELVAEANEKLWQFDIAGRLDSIQYTEYYEGGGHYDWHIDIGPAPINHRKISVTIQLSDPQEYEGGDFEIWNGGGFKTVDKAKGTAILFPSYLMHRVTPVTKGTRKSLVLWVGGQPFK